MTRACSRPARRATPPDQAGLVAAVVFLIVVAAGAAAGFTDAVALPPLASLVCGAVVIAAAVGACLPVTVPSTRAARRRPAGRQLVCPEPPLGERVPRVA